MQDVVAACTNCCSLYLFQADEEAEIALLQEQETSQNGQKRGPDGAALDNDALTKKPRAMQVTFSFYLNLDAEESPCPYSFGSVTGSVCVFFISGLFLSAGGGNNCFYSPLTICCRPSTPMPLNSRLRINNRGLDSPLETSQIRMSLGALARTVLPSMRWTHRKTS